MSYPTTVRVAGAIRIISKTGTPKDCRTKRRGAGRDQARCCEEDEGDTSRWRCATRIVRLSALKQSISNGVRRSLTNLSSRYDPRQLPGSNDEGRMSEPIASTSSPWGRRDLHRRLQVNGRA